MQKDPSTKTAYAVPPKKDDLTFAVNSVWQPRRVVITKECVSFAFVGNDDEIDRVPLTGVDFVKNHDENISMEAKGQNGFCLQIATSPTGYNSGRSYMLRTDSAVTQEDTILLLSKLSKDAKKRAAASTLFRKLQRKVKKFYERDFCQGFVALIIMMVSADVQRPARRPPSKTPWAPQSFFCTIMESQYTTGLVNADGTKSQLGTLLTRLNLFYTVFFTVELGVCTFGNWFWPLLSDGWYDALLPKFSTFQRHQQKQHSR